MIASNISVARTSRRLPESPRCDLSPRSETSRQTTVLQILDRLQIQVVQNNCDSRAVDVRCKRIDCTRCTFASSSLFTKNRTFSHVIYYTYNVILNIGDGNRLLVSA